MRIFRYKSGGGGGGGVQTLRKYIGYIGISYQVHYVLGEPFITMRVDIFKILLFLGHPNVHVHSHTCRYPHTHMNTFTHTHTHTYTHTHTHTNTHTHTQTQTHMHIHVHIQKRMSFILNDFP